MKRHLSIASLTVHPWLMTAIIAVCALMLGCVTQRSSEQERMLSILSDVPARCDALEVTCASGASEEAAGGNPLVSVAEILQGQLSQELGMSREAREADVVYQVPYAELVSLINTEPTTGERFGTSGKEYQFEIMVVWDDKPLGDVRVIGNVDDGGWRAYVPMGTSFIKAPDDTFVGE